MEATFRDELKGGLSRRATVLKNKSCLYCGCILTADTQTKEHVIGRRFVPKGKLEAQWNLIGNSCAACNSAKGDLEDDISSITLQPDLMGEVGHTDTEVINRARERAKKSISRRTKRPVADSHEQMEIKFTLTPGVVLSFNLIAPAQIDESRIFKLAEYHIVAFYYNLTYCAQERTGGFHNGGVHCIKHVNRRDWGNPLMRGFMTEVAAWTTAFATTSANGFFKCIIRKHPKVDLFSWALEWNHSSRIIGFLGDINESQMILNGFPKPRTLSINGSMEYSRVRIEEPLSRDCEDILFNVKESTSIIAGE